MLERRVSKETTLQIRLLFRGTINRIIILGDTVGLHSRDVFVPVQVHSRRDQTRSDHARGRPPTTHLAIEDEVASVLIGRRYPL